MSATREDIYQALFDLVTPLRAAGAIDGFPDGSGEGKAQPGTPTSDRPFNMVTREFIEVQRVPPGLQPVLLQYEFDEVFSENRYGMVACEIKCGFMIGIATKRGSLPQSELNCLGDAVIAAIAPPNGEERQTLDNKVDRLIINGTANKNGGNNSTAGWRQGALWIPVSIFPIGAGFNG